MSCTEQKIAVVPRKTHLAEQVHVRVAQTLFDLQVEQWSQDQEVALHTRYFHWLGVVASVPARLAANVLNCVDL